jgi:hypothetical protein
VAGRYVVKPEVPPWTLIKEVALPLMYLDVGHLTPLRRERWLLLAEIAHHAYGSMPFARDVDVLPSHGPLGIGASASHEGSLGF